MIEFHPIHAFSDNYIWAMVNTQTQQTIVIDPGQANPVIDFIKQQQLTLTEIWVTHKHPDHIGGIDDLVRQFPHIKLVAHTQHGVHQMYQSQKSKQPQQNLQCVAVDDNSQIRAWTHDTCDTQVWHVPGHTQHHLAYLVKVNNTTHVFCGDTLFSGGCGRVFTGDMQAMFTSLQRFNGLAANNTWFYPAHEYTASNLTFGLHIEPNNTAMQNRLDEVKQLTNHAKSSLPSSLALEQQINVFLRVTEPAIIEKLQHEHMLTNTNPVNVFTTLRQLKDGF